MYIKTPAKVTGIPAARVAVSPGVTDQGMGQVMAVISALDAYDCPTVVASLRLSLDEANELRSATIKASRMEGK